MKIEYNCQKAIERGIDVIEHHKTLNENLKYLYEPPDFITPAGSPGEEYEFFENAIISTSELQTLQNDLCVKISHPTAIIEFKEKEERTDSQNSNFSLQFVCESIRIFFHDQVCKDCDKRTAELFRGLSIKHLANNIGEKIKNQYKNAGGSDSIPVYEKDKHHGHLRSICHMSGFTELAFPIVVEEKIIGVLFVGQLKLAEFMEKSKKIRKEFLESQYDALLDYCSKTKEDAIFADGDWTPEYLTNKLVEDNKKEDNPFPRIYNHDMRMLNPHTREVLDEDDYKKLIDKIYEGLQELESKLEEKLRERRISYIKQRIEIANTAFHNEFSNFSYSTAKSQEKLDAFWQISQSMLDSLSNHLSLKTVTILGSKIFESFDEEAVISFRVVASTHNSDKKLEYDLNAIKNFPTIPYIVEPTDIDNEFYKALSISPQNINLNYLLIFPANGKKQSSLVVVITFCSDVNREINHQVCEQIKNFIMNIFYSLSMVKSRISENRTKDTMIIYRHETSNTASELSAMYKENFDQYKGKEKILIKKFNDIGQDISSASSQLAAMSTKIGLILGRITPDKKNFEEFYIIKDLFYRWTNIYSRYEKSKFLSFDLPHTDSDDEMRPSIFSDYDLMDQIVYNIVKNALKYSYFGTKIKLDYKRCYPDSAVKVITVTSYGYAIEEGPRPYELYYRGNHGPDVSEDGSGIGLYVVKKAVELLGGTVTHTCTQVSEYHVPFIKRHIKLAEKNKEMDQKFCILLEAELQRLKNNFLYDEIVADDVLIDANNRFDVTDAEILAQIGMKTNKVVFEVEIP